MSAPPVAVITQVTVLARDRWMYDESATTVRMVEKYVRMAGGAAATSASKVAAPV